MVDFILTGLCVACAAFSFVQIIQPGEIFASYGKAINQFLSGDKYPNPETIKGFKYVIYKYHYCAFCLSGFLGVVAAFFIPNLMAFIIVPAVAMTTARIIESWTNR